MNVEPGVATATPEPRDRPGPPEVVTIGRVFLQLVEEAPIGNGGVRPKGVVDFLDGRGALERFILTASAPDLCLHGHFTAVLLEIDEPLVEHLQPMD